LDNYIRNVLYCKDNTVINEECTFFKFSVRKDTFMTEIENKLCKMRVWVNNFAIF